MLWIIQSNLRNDIPIVILYDNQPAAFTVSGLCVGRSCINLCKLSCAVHRHASYLYCITDHHVKSHDQHPWNELVDSLCSHCVRVHKNLLLEQHRCHQLVNLVFFAWIVPLAINENHKKNAGTFIDFIDFKGKNPTNENNPVRICDICEKKYLNLKLSIKFKEKKAKYEKYIKIYSI